MKIAIIGTGTMGQGIVQTMAQAGQAVLWKGRSQKSIDKALQSIDKGLARLVEKEKISAADKQATLQRITTTLENEPLREMDLLIEAIAEDMPTKLAIFHELDAICSPNCILATNTSSLSITEIANCISHPERVIGMHFFNPVPMMKLVEMIDGQLTSKAVSDQVFNLALAIGKSPVRVAEAPGFVVNRILVPMINEAIGILADGVAEKEAIDEAMKLGANHPMGPLALGDLIGLDVCLAIMDVLYSEFGDPKYRANPLLRKMVRANLLGRKTGIGFFDYRK